MKATALVGVILSIVLAGCSLRAKTTKSAVPAAAPRPVARVTPPPAPPSPLSIPQTQVELPKPQPLDPAALETEEAVAPEAPPAATTPARSRRTAPAASQSVTPAPPATTPAPEPRPTVQEILSPAELKRLQDRAQSRRNEVKQILDQLSRRQLSGAQQNVVKDVRNFLSLSSDAESHNDMRQADAQAERAWILAKELQSGQ